MWYSLLPLSTVQTKQLLTSYKQKVKPNQPKPKTMKKFILVFIALTIAVCFQAKAVKPIPSYNSPLYNLANFQEKQHNDKNGIKEKRDMCVQSTTTGGGHTNATIWIYSLDFRTILGPFILTDNDKITVQVDEREWGVLVLTDAAHLSVSVWIDKEGSGGTKAENQIKSYDDNFGTYGLLNNVSGIAAIRPRFSQNQSI
jgi:hypothetical protein